MTVTANVTRYATGYVRGTCVIPTDPTRTEPNRPYCNYWWSPPIHSVRFRTRDAARAATASSAKPQPGHDRFGWMVQGFNGGQR